jgi:hypothetical protein
MRFHLHEEYPELSLGEEFLKMVSRIAVQALTTGSASGRRRDLREHRRYPDPGSSPDRIRQLARHIEASFTTMPNGWVSADETRGHPHG